MKKATIAFLLAFVLVTPTFAQTDSLRREIGFSTQIIFDNIFESQGAPFNLMFKKQMKDNTWIRYGLETHINLGNTDREGDTQYFNTSSETYGAAVSPSIGLEKRVHLHERWKFIYGADLAASYEYRKLVNRSTDSNLPPQIYYSTDQIIHGYGGNLRPFLGLLFSPVNRLYISTEASAILGGNFNNIKINKYENDMIVSEMNQDSEYYNFSLRPASAIYVYYRF